MFLLHFGDLVMMEATGNRSLSSWREGSWGSQQSSALNGVINDRSRLVQIACIFKEGEDFILPYVFRKKTLTYHLSDACFICSAWASIWGDCESTTSVHWTHYYHWPNKDFLWLIVPITMRNSDIQCYTGRTPRLRPESVLGIRKAIER